MIGWLLFAGFALVLVVALGWWLRFDRGLIMLSGAAVAIAAAGYVWQGRPDLAGHPAEALAAAKPAETLFADERSQWMDTLGLDAQVLDTADAFIRNGDPAYAVGVTRGAITRRPKSAMLWIGLGNALVHYAGGPVTPAAYYAFDRAATLRPHDPAAPYFLGLAEALSGNIDGAIDRWRRLIDHAPDGAPWRPLVAQKLMLLESLRNNTGKSAP